MVKRTVAERFWSKVDKDGPNGCWLWTGARVSGYGKFWDGVEVVYAHRYARPTTADLQVDHLCRNRACVRPDHLEPVTQRVNIRRAADAVTHCPAGHPYDEGNTYVCKRGKRSCRACRRRDHGPAV